MELEHVSGKVLNEEKEKTSFNLSKTTLANLEDCWMEMRKLSGSKQISRTLIMEVAFLMAFCEYKNKKVDSDFYKELLMIIGEDSK